MRNYLRIMKSNDVLGVFGVSVEDNGRKDEAADSEKYIDATCAEISR